MAKQNKALPAVTWAQAFRDIINKSMDRGQLFPMLAFLGVLAMIIKMPEDKVYTFGVDILNGLQNFSLLGWVLSSVIAILWAGHARQMRRQHSLEYKRMGQEKSKLQASASKRITLKSSDS
ncbi:hypothetical protein K6327_000923 [Vibrio vulnificus]|nr:hypothetical protein [Vibrio vulnificus]